MDWTLFLGSFFFVKENVNQIHFVLQKKDLNEYFFQKKPLHAKEKKSSEIETAP